MKNKYKLVNQKPNYCFPCVLEIIMKKMNIDSYNQEDIGENLNAIEDESEKIVAFSTNDLNTELFEKNNIDLKEHYFTPGHTIKFDSSLSDLKKILLDKEIYNDTSFEIILFSNFKCLSKGINAWRKLNREGRKVSHTFILIAYNKKRDTFLSICPEVSKKGGTFYLEIPSKNIRDSFEIIGRSGYGLSFITNNSIKNSECLKTIKSTIYNFEV